MKLKKFLTLGLAAAIGITMTACSSGGESSKSEGSKAESSKSDSSASSSAEGGASDAPIVVVSREEGSGTRGAFVELFGIEEKDAEGNKIDNTTEDAEITNSTAVMMTTVAGNKDAVGYISLGSLNDTVKALKVDGIEATAENVKSGTYKIVRPFNIAAKDEISAVAQDFIDFIMSADGQKVIEDKGYIKVSDAPAYSGSKPAGKVVVAGSSSVAPVMEALKEAYLAVNTGAEIEVQQSDSTTGMNSAIDGICDIGMASREIKDSETEKGLKGTVIAQDGIAIIVSPDSAVSEITSETVKGIYTGEIANWNEVK